MDVPTIGNDSESEIDYEAEEEEQEDRSESEGDSEDTLSDDEHSAWVDDDDKNLKISLNATNITKKLRNDAEEDVISGSEYTRRLRRQ